MALTSQISFEPAFLKGLLDKLKVGNRQGIHLNALPGHHRARLDLKDLDFIKDGLASAFLEKLTTETAFRFQIDFEGIDMTELTEKQKERLFLIARRLNNTVIDENDQYLEFGVRNFALGYPLIIRRDKSDPEKVIKAPLFLWSLSIERSPRKANCWTISREEGAPIVMNELLRAHIANDAQVSLERIQEDVLSDGVIDLKEIGHICTDILQQLNIRTSGVKSAKPKIEASLTKQKTEALATDDAWILWAGVFGLYRARKEPIIRRTEELLKDLKKFKDEKLELEDFQKSTASAVDTDPSKEEIIRSLTKSEFKLIQGPPGTGKSQAVTAIITNTLENRGRCLVVCEKRTALEVVYKNLKDVGLEDYAVLIEDVNRDRKLVVSKARSRAETLVRRSGSQEFDNLYLRYERLKESMGKRNAALLEEVMGDLKWNDVVGLFLKHSKNLESPGHLMSHEKCKFTHDEYIQLGERVDEASLLYSACDIPAQTALENLRSVLFNDVYSRATLDSITHFVEEKLLALEKAQESVKGLIKISTDGLQPFEGSIELDEWVKRMEGALKVLAEAKEALESCPVSVGEGKEGLVQLSLVERVGSVILPKIKAVRVAKGKYEAACAEFKKLQQDFPEQLEVIVLPQSPTTSVKAAQEVVATMSEKLEKVLASATVLIALHKKVMKEELALVKVTDAWTNQKHVSLQGPLSLGSYEKGLVKELEFFKSLQEQLPAFKAFHDWKYFMTKVTSFEKAVINKLLKVETDSWGNVARAWYLYGLLAKTENKIPGAPEGSVEELIEVVRDMRLAQIKKIKSTWDTSALFFKQQFERTSGVGFNLVYNLARNRASNKLFSLRQIVEKDFNTFTSIFPIVLTSPMVADSILPLKQGIFDVVIFDEASQLRIEDTFTSMIRGKFKIIAGDEHQMPPSSYFEAANTHTIDEGGDEVEEGYVDVEGEMAKSGSLLDYGLNLPENQRNRSYLDYHYRSKHPALIEFSNAAFYGRNLVAFPEAVAYTPLELRQVDGVYKENRNQKEVEEVLKIMCEDIRPNKDGKYPSIGIATFNLKQRDAIIDALTLESIDNPAFATTLEEVKKRGFFVKNLENIQGDEMDVVIISTTYGKDGSGRFLERFGPVNLEKGYKLLNVLITRAKSKVFVCTSVPATKYRQYAIHIESGGNHRKGILYAYLAYVEAVSSKNQENTEAILRLLETHSHDQPRTTEDSLVESPFEQEVYEILLEDFGEQAIKPQVKAGGFRIDFVITLPDGRKVALECDGKTYHSSNEAYAYDIYRQSELENMGYAVYRIWSTNWWHNHEQEKKKLMQFIEKMVGSK